MPANKRSHSDYRRITVIFRVCLVSAVLCAFLPPLLQADEATGKSMFLLVYRPGPAWIAGKPQSQQRLKEHFNYILDRYAQGEVKLAGGFTDEAAGGAVVLVVDNEVRANEFARSDPAVKESVFAYELRPWRPVDWELQLRKRNEKRTEK
jgi:uncharacterized protein